jgi:hypothetical protein
VHAQWFATPFELGVEIGGAEWRHFTMDKPPSGTRPYRGQDAMPKIDVLVDLGFPDGVDGEDFAIEDSALERLHDQGFAIAAGILAHGLADIDLAKLGVFAETLRQRDIAHRVHIRLDEAGDMGIEADCGQESVKQAAIVRPFDQGANCADGVRMRDGRPSLDPRDLGLTYPS